jgi:hypothetical protein
MQGEMRVVETKFVEKVVGFSRYKTLYSKPHGTTGQVSFTASTTHQIQGVQKVTQLMEKCNINFIFYYYAYFL